MHDLFITLTFMALLITPVLLAAFAGKQKKEASVEEIEVTVISEAVSTRQAPAAAGEARTLPLRGTLGLANR